MHFEYVYVMLEHSSFYNPVSDFSEDQIWPSLLHPFHTACNTLHIAHTPPPWLTNGMWANYESQTCWYWIMPGGETWLLFSNSRKNFFFKLSKPNGFSESSFWVFLFEIWKLFEIDLTDITCSPLDLQVITFDSFKSTHLRVGGLSHSLLFPPLSFPNFFSLSLLGLVLSWPQFLPPCAVTHCLSRIFCIRSVTLSNLINSIYQPIHHQSHVISWALHTNCLLCTTDASILWPLPSVHKIQHRSASKIPSSDSLPSSCHVLFVSQFNYVTPANASTCQSFTDLSISSNSLPHPYVPSGPHLCFKWTDPFSSVYPCWDSSQISLKLKLFLV